MAHRYARHIRSLRNAQNQIRAVRKKLAHPELGDALAAQVLAQADDRITQAVDLLDGQRTIEHVLHMTHPTPRTAQ